MTARPMGIRTMDRTARGGPEQGLRGDLAYTGEPTPEQLADDGRCDRIIAIPAERFQRRLRLIEHLRVRRIERAYAGTAIGNCGRAITIQALRGARVMHTFHSIVEASIALGISESSVTKALAGQIIRKLGNLRLKRISR